MTWSKVGIVAAVCGSMMIGYCIYFDRKRRLDPDFKKKLRERREAKKNAEKMRSGRSTQFPKFDDHEAVQAFFLKEIQAGEELLGQGKIEEGVEHIANAVSVCGQPQQLLGVLQQTLPPNVFSSLIERLPIVGQVRSENSEKNDASPCWQCVANRVQHGTSSASVKSAKSVHRTMSTDRTAVLHRKATARHRVPRRRIMSKTELRSELHRPILDHILPHRTAAEREKRHFSSMAPHLASPQ